ncbi:MAG: reductive dehalogenase [Desulfatiglandales bacterium]|jgi:reductive dehalogenase|nr:reductive dehalogenase [Desulfatiglandales bacterium]
MGIVTSFMRAFQTDRLDPYPTHVIKRIERPTVRIKEEEIEKVDGRNSGFNRAARGKFGPFLQKERPRIVTKHPLGAALTQMQVYLKDMVEETTAPTTAPIPDDPALITRHIKKTAYFLRADLVGVCELPPYAVLSHNLNNGDPVECNHKYAIAILVDQDWNTSEASFGNDWISGPMSFIGYTNSGFISRILADYIRKLGYPAKAQHAFSYEVVVPPVLVWAGLGEMSRIGDIVVNPFIGPRFKAAVVTTDLPLVPDKPIDFGLQDFCSKCKKCARECPSGAISFGDKVSYNGYERWPLDIKKCASMRIGNKYGASCGVCMTVCPWNKPFTPFHRLVEWTMRNIPAARRFAIWGDDLMGYGKPKLENKWWLDLEDVDGTLRIPNQS